MHKTVNSWCTVPPRIYEQYIRETMEIEQVCVIPTRLSDLSTVYSPLVKHCVEGMLQKPADPIALVHFTGYYI